MAQTENFNRENVLKALADIVDEYGADHVYEFAHANCRYSNQDGTPSCIVGHVLSRVAPEMFARIHHYEWADRDNPVSCAVGHLGNEGYELDADTERETHDLIYALSVGQAAQDNGLTWGHAEDTIRARLGEGPRYGKA